MRNPSESPTQEELQCLNGWPSGTIGHAKDHALIDGLLSLCNEHGFGRVHQVMGWIEDIWRHPMKVEREYKKMHANQMELMAKTIKFYQEEKSSK